MKKLQNRNCQTQTNERSHRHIESHQLNRRPLMSGIHKILLISEFRKIVIATLACCNFALCDNHSHYQFPSSYKIDLSIFPLSEKCTHIYRKIHSDYFSNLNLSFNKESITFNSQGNKVEYLHFVMLCSIATQLVKQENPTSAPLLQNNDRLYLVLDFIHRITTKKTPIVTPYLRKNTILYDLPVEHLYYFPFKIEGGSTIPLLCIFDIKSSSAFESEPYYVIFILSHKGPPKIRHTADFMNYNTEKYKYSVFAIKKAPLIHNNQWSTNPDGDIIDELILNRGAVLKFTPYIKNFPPVMYLPDGGTEITE